VNKPLVSIIIPVFNAEKYLGETINSAIDQTWENMEIIIIDDGSTDNSLTIAKQFSCENVKVYTQENKGASVARNNGLSKARGEYIQFLDADDILSADKIEGQMNCLNGSGTHLALCRVVHFDDGANYLESVLTDEVWFCADSNDPVDFLLKLHAGNEIMPGYGSMIQPNSWLTPMALIEKAGPWNEFRCPDDDGEFFCRVILASEGIKYSTVGTNYYRKFKHINTLSAQKSLQAYENILLSIDLKYHHLKEKANSPLLEQIFAKHYWEIGVASYPQYKELSKNALNKAITFGYKGKKYKAGPVSTFLSKIIGWRLARILTYLRYQNSIK
jgi:glycosyltransferase involved in cell wall biosynthesis